MIGYRKSRNMSAFADVLSRPLFWAELDFYRARQIKFIKYFRDLFGADVPMMYRAAAPRREAGPAEISIYQLDKMARLVAAYHDIEVFDWGHTLHGYGEFYKDSIHVMNGPHATVYLNMMFYYLHRASGGIEVKGTIVQTPEQAKAIEGYNPADAWARCNLYNTRLASH